MRRDPQLLSRLFRGRRRAPAAHPRLSKQEEARLLREYRALSRNATIAYGRAHDLETRGDALYRASQELSRHLLDAGVDPSLVGEAGEEGVEDGRTVLIREEDRRGQQRLRRHPR